MIKLKSIAFTIVIIFGFFGAFVVGTILHEYSHYNDFKEIAKDNQICGLNLPLSLNISYSTAAGYYQYQIKPDNETSNNTLKYENIHKHTEFKAYLLESTIAFIFVVFATISIINYRDNNKNYGELIKYGIGA